MNVAELYEPLIERDLARIPAAAREFRQSHSGEEMFLAVARFAVLAYAPSQHAKHATLATLAAYELRDELAGRWDDLLVECAIYASQSRQPWSEAPLLDPPPVQAGQRHDVDELREAVAARDRLRAERWLAARLGGETLAADLFAVASDDFEDLGHKLIIANAAWKLSTILGEKGRFAALRIAVWEMVACQGGRRKAEGGSMDETALLESLIEACVAEKGSIESAHAVFLFDAAMETKSERAMMHLSALSRFHREGTPHPPSAPSPRAAGRRHFESIYRLARDYAACLKAHAVAKRLSKIAPMDDFLAAVRHNLEHAPSFEEWSLA